MMSSTLQPWLAVVPIVMVLMNPASAPAQEAKLPPGNLSVLQIRVTEYTLLEPIDESLSNTELLEKILATTDRRQNQPSPTKPFALAGNVLRFTHVVGVESTIRVGRKINVIVGETRDPRGTIMRNAKSEEIGTLLKLVTTPTDSGAFVAQISYESSELGQSGPDSISPDVTELTFESSVVLETGKTALLIANNDRNPKVITITVE